MGFRFVLSTFLQRIIAKPLRKLSALASQIAIKGDYSLRMEVRGKDETGMLTQAFNHMLDQIERRDSELQLANQAKSDFVANTSHEIRTPINNIIGFSEMLQDTELGADQVELLTMVKTSAGGLLGVINDILDISKIEAGKLELDVVPTNVGERVKHVLAPLKLQATRKGVDFEIVADKELPEFLEVDGLRFGQVVINLVNNAIKFTEPPGKITVSVEVESKGTEEATILVSVKDTGVGIPEDAQQRIFEAFSQADASTTRKFGGTGLGLAISAHIVRMMNGKIWVDSQVGEGATFLFTLTLPVVSDADSEEVRAHINSTVVLPTVSPTDENATRILLVEDNDMSRQIALHRLTKFGYDVTVAANGKEAVSLFKVGTFDLIFMDCQMPEMDGFEATAVIREIEKERENRTPIVALTAHAMEGYKNTCIESGMDDYVTKPIKEAELARFLAKFTKEKREREGGGEEEAAEAESGSQGEVRV